MNCFGFGLSVPEDVRPLEFFPGLADCLVGNGCFPRIPTQDKTQDALHFRTGRRDEAEGERAPVMALKKASTRTS